MTSENKSYAREENYHVVKRSCELVRATNRSEKVLFNLSWYRVRGLPIDEAREEETNLKCPECKNPNLISTPRFQQCEECGTLIFRDVRTYYLTLIFDC